MELVEVLEAARLLVASKRWCRGIEPGCVCSATAVEEVISDLEYGPPRFEMRHRARTVLDEVALEMMGEIDKVVSWRAEQDCASAIARCAAAFLND